jgi:hypothetical protein
LHLRGTGCLDSPRRHAERVPTQIALHRAAHNATNKAAANARTVANAYVLQPDLGLNGTVNL